MKAEYNVSIDIDHPVAEEDNLPEGVVVECDGKPVTGWKYAAPGEKGCVVAVDAEKEERPFVFYTGKVEVVLTTRAAVSMFSSVKFFTDMDSAFDRIFGMALPL